MDDCFGELVIINVLLVVEFLVGEVFVDGVGGIEDYFFKVV